jgi:predicted tellurium resistance membrane protein TerC
MPEFFEPMTTAGGLISLLTLVLLEIVLGVDNIIFIAILTGYLPKKDQHRARIIGLTMALIFRVILLFTISWLVRLTKPLFTLVIFGNDFGASGRDLILFAGGVFLIVKTIQEIIEKFRVSESHGKIKERKLTVPQAILQITFIPFLPLSVCQTNCPL